MAETKTVQQRLVDAFVHRPHGFSGDCGTLASLSIILRAKHGFTGRLQSSADLLALSDEHAKIALDQLPMLHVPRDPELALRLVANEERRRSGT